jgi:hypothetical protein
MHVNIPALTAFAANYYGTHDRHKISHVCYLEAMYCLLDGAIIVPTPEMHDLIKAIAGDRRLRGELGKAFTKCSQSAA